MHCTQCGTFIVPGWNACSSCKVSLLPEVVATAHKHAEIGLLAKYPGAPDHELREALFGVRLDDLTSGGLSDWLEELGADPRGTIEQKRSRIRECTTFLDAPSRDMIAEALDDFRTSDARVLEAICDALGYPGGGTKSKLLRRLHLIMALREGIVPTQPHAGTFPTPQELYPFLDWYTVYQLKSNARERDLYPDFFEAMCMVYGDELVHEQVAIAHGSSLKIDFHIGSTAIGQPGIGIEFKMPASNSDVQKSIGQLGQYQTRYGQSLTLVLFEDFIETKHLHPFFHELHTRGIAYLVKRAYW
jgi:hypothetical protein